MKFKKAGPHQVDLKSPPVWGAWIEIAVLVSKSAI